MGGSRFQRKRRRPTMAPPQLPTTIEKLPDHLLSNILIRVPATTLVQLRSVSKPWNAFLSQPSFIKSHLDRSIKHNDEILVVFKFYISDEVTAHPSKSPHLELPNFIKLPVDPYDNTGDPYIGHELIGAVNGLICSYNVSESDYYIQIWNPSISAVLELQAGQFLSGEFQNKFRFGYDPKNDDYKVVRLAIFAGEPEDFVPVEVFSMRKGCWKLITERFPANFYTFEEDKVCGDGHDGHLHWLCYVDNDPNLQTIEAYDLSSETMSEICLPVGNHKDRRNVVGVLAGKLCLMSCLKDHNCEVWLMNEYGNGESWAKHHVFSQFNASISPFGFTLSNEFVFAAFNVLSLFDPVADKVKSFMFVVEPFTRFVSYVDSLVWITPDKS